MNINIRIAQESDVSSILEILNFEILNTTVVYDYEERTYEMQLDWFHQKQKNGMPIIIAESEGVVIGYGSFGIYRPWQAYRYSVEHSVYVHNRYRGSGVGEKLLLRLISLAKLKGMHTMIAGVDASNKKSIDFHKKFGFKEVGVIKEVGYKFDKWLDLSFMQLFLK